MQNTIPRGDLTAARSANWTVTRDRGFGRTVTRLSRRRMRPEGLSACRRKWHANEEVAFEVFAASDRADAAFRIDVEMTRFGLLVVAMEGETG